ncbi:MAG: GNAT family N-acetyltransferase [Anaerolineales bacterium]|nr:GNAT family N-acetyltransferase [Anaerolineales bacterium]
MFQFPQDYQAVHDLWSLAGEGIQLRRSDDPDEIEKKVQRDPDLFLLAEAGDCLVGTVLGGFDGRRGLVYHLAVAPDFRQEGIGGLLMEELERRLRDKGCIRCYLLVTVENATAMAFYEKRGWERMENVYTYGKNL